MSTLMVRPPRPSDEGRWRARRIVSDGGEVFARVAADAFGATGFAICVLHPISWSTRPACLLEDLFVDPAHRGQGVGRQLIDSVRAEATAQGWARPYWHTQADNSGARRLYDSYTPADGFVRYSLALDPSAHCCEYP